MSGSVWLLFYAALFYFMMRFGYGVHVVHGHGGHGAAHGDSGDKDSVCNRPVADDDGYAPMVTANARGASPRCSSVAAPMRTGHAPVALERRLSAAGFSRMVDPRTVKLSLDKDGALVTLEPGSWFVCFVPGIKKQWWHRFVNKRHTHVFALRPEGPDRWTVFEPWWNRLLTASVTSLQAKKFLAWGARGDVLLAREVIPGRGSQVRGWMNCAVLASYLLGRPYWVWTPHGLYKRLLREPNVCRVDVGALLQIDPARLAESRAIEACAHCAQGAPRQPGAYKPFCMHCGRDLR